MVTQPQSDTGASDAAGWRPALRGVGESLFQRLLSPVDIASLVFFRIFFGIIAFWHVWLQVPIVNAEYIVPEFHFKYYGFGWVEPLPGEMMNAVFLAMAASAILIALGLYYRAAAVVFFVLQTYALLIDVANYWNHYYLFILVGFLMIFVPAHRAFSLDVARGAVFHSNDAPSWGLWILRGQMAIVYFFAGLAKATSGDWWDGEPMRGYLATQPGFPFVGRWFNEGWMVDLASYSGMLFDLFIIPLLLWRPPASPPWPRQSCFTSATP
jgi:vitamin K-dependent gamma-carboxylase